MTGYAASGSSNVDMLEPPEGDAPTAVLAQLVDKLQAADDRTVVAVRVFWVPTGLPTRLESGRIAVWPRDPPPASHIPTPCA